MSSSRIFFRAFKLSQTTSVRAKWYRPLMIDSNIICLCFLTCYGTRSLNLWNDSMCFLSRVEIPRHGNYNVCHIYFNPEVVVSAKLLGFSLNSHDGSCYITTLKLCLNKSFSPRVQLTLWGAPEAVLPSPRMAICLRIALESQALWSMKVSTSRRFPCFQRIGSFISWNQHTPPL